MRAAVGQLELAAPHPGRAGERAALVTEQLALDQLGWNRGAVDLDERPRRERALAVDVRGEQLLAGSRFAGQQHAGVGPRDLRGLVDHVAERVAPADHLRRVADQLPEPLVLALQIRSLDRVLDHEEHAVAGQRLLQEVERAGSRRLDRVADRAVTGDHDHRRGIVALLQRAQDVDAVAVGKAHVEQVQVGPARGAMRLKLGDRSADRHAVALALEDQPQRRTDVRLVVDDDDAVFALHARTPSGESHGPAEAGHYVRRASLAPPAGPL